MNYEGDIAVVRDGPDTFAKLIIGMSHFRSSNEPN